MDKLKEILNKAKKNKKKLVINSVAIISISNDK